MARVVRTPLARDDLKQIGRYIAQESGSRVAALRMLDLVRQKMELYATQPELGESRPDLGSDVRHFPVKSYVVFYRPLDDGIEVLRVLHGSRDIRPFGAAAGKTLKSGGRGAARTARSHAEHGNED